MLFPYGSGFFAAERRIPITFAEWFNHLLRTTESARFQANARWLQWAKRIAHALATIRSGEGQRTLNPLRERKALAALIRINPAYQCLHGRDIFALLETGLAKIRQEEGIVIEECAICHADECPEKPGLKLSRCSRCRKVFYCGRKHQAEDWKARHKKQCKKLMEASDTVEVALPYAILMINT